MKNKTLTRVLSFCLALILCFTWNIAQPLVANAFALESGWVLYAIISFMVASGITLSAVGGIEALQSAVEDKWDDFTEYKKGKGEIIDLAPYVKYIPPSSPTPNNPNGLTPKFWYGATAFAILFEFIQWLRSELKDNNEQLTTDYKETFYYAWLDGSLTKIICPNLELIEENNWNTGDTFKYKITNNATIIPIEKIGTSSDNLGNFYFTYLNYEGGLYYYPTFTDTSITLRFYNPTTGNIGSFIYYDHSKAFRDFGYSPENIVGILINFDEFGNDGQGDRVYQDYFVMDDGFVIAGQHSYTFDLPFAFTQAQSSTITIPDNFPDFEVSEGECLELDFSQFQSDINSVDTPEEFTEAVKHEIISSGSFPSVQTEIKPDPNIKPNPEPDIPDEPSIDTPTEPSPDQLTDVGELGLPSLGSAMLKKFPFSLPLTFASILQIFSAERQTPKWDIEFPAPLSVSFTIDLSNYEELGTILRVTTTIGYCLGLILATRKFISW